MKIYLARPISGQSFEEVQDYYDQTKEYLTDMGYDVLSPMTGKQELRTELEFKAQGYDNIPVATNHAIYNRDQWMVRQSDMVYANLMSSNGRVSIGAMMEIAWAAMLGKHVIVAMEKDNIHQHAFVLEAAGTIFNNHEDVINYLVNFSEK